MSFGALKDDMLFYAGHGPQKGPLQIYVSPLCFCFAKNPSFFSLFQNCLLRWKHFEPQQRCRCLSFLLYTLLDP